MPFEHRSHRMLSRREFARRWGKWALFALAAITVSLFGGAAGYRYWVHVERWVDAVHAAAMILTGMGPAQDVHVETDGGKIFETVYAIFSGVVFISVAGMLLGPPAHRILHRLHLDEGEADLASSARPQERAAVRKTPARRNLD